MTIALSAKGERYAQDRLDETSAEYYFLVEDHVEDEFAIASHLGPKGLAYVHGPGADTSKPPKGMGLLKSFHADYVWGGKYEVRRNGEMGPESVDRDLPWEIYALRVEKSTGDKCPTCKGECVRGDYKEECSECLGLGLVPSWNPAFDRLLRPYVFYCIALCRGWTEVKQRCLEGYAPAGQPGAGDAEHREAVAAAKKPNRTKLMLALIAFRNHYIKSMVQKLKNEGLSIVSQAVGSADVTSDYDVTLAGPDDIYAFAELNQAFRAAWGRESGVVLDTNFYFLREWLPVGNNIVKDARGQDVEGDDFLQLDMDEQVGDLYSLAKIRRYTSKVEWEALKEAISRGCSVDGVPGDEIPMFKRLDLVDRIYRVQYVDALLERLETVHQQWTESLLEHAPADQPQATRQRAEKLTPRTLERLIHAEPNEVLHACNMAYLELVALTRHADALIRAEYGQEGSASAKVRRVRRKTMATAQKGYVDSGLSGSGLYQRNRVCGKLFSEAHLFAAESYNSQASMKDVVGEQGKFRGDLVFLPHEFLHCFNEQVGDGLKEVREYQRMVDAYLEHEKRMAHSGGGARGPDPQYIGTGFFRASKYEIRMRQALNALCESLKTYPPVKDRIDGWKKLFPDKPEAPEEADLRLLGQELQLATRWQAALNTLLDIRKARGEYQSMTLDKKREKATELLRTVVKSPEFQAAARARDREATRLDYRGAYTGVMKPAPDKPKYKPEGDAWGLRHLTDYLLHHCAQVNQIARRILCRGPIRAYVYPVPEGSE